MELDNFYLKGVRDRGFDHGIRKTATAFVTKLRKSWINMRKRLVSSFLWQFIYWASLAHHILPQDGIEIGKNDLGNRVKVVNVNKRSLWAR
jgi:hypothetical protein